MSKLIEEFKSEHAALVSLLIEIKRLDVHSKETRIKLLKAKNHLLTHLEKEDHYPVLRKASEGSHNIKRKLTHFGRDMEDITGFVRYFFRRLENESYTPPEFSHDFSQLLSLLLGRISREENILYPMYEEYLYQKTILA